MSLGGKYISIANPQPGTTNTPYPAGSTPPFSPVTVTVSTDHAYLIGVYYGEIIFLLEGIQASLNEINKGLREIDHYWKQIPPAVDNLPIAVASIAPNISNKSIILAAKATNQIKTNNFNVSLQKQAGVVVQEPVMATQILNGIKDANVMRQAVVAETAVVQTTTYAANTVVGWITGTETYKSIAEYFAKIKDRLLKNILPATAADAKSAAVGAGTYPLPYTQ